MTTAPVVETVDLSWEGPYSLRAGSADSVWIQAVSGEPGIWVWTVPTPRGSLVHRVGSSGKPLWLALYEELTAFQRGEYVIHRVASLAAGRRDPVFRGIGWHREGRVERQQHFRNQWPRLKAQVDGLVGLVGVYLAPLGCGARQREEVEAAVVWGVRSGGPGVSGVLEVRGRAVGR